MALGQRDENLLWVGTEIFPALVAAIETPPIKNGKIAIIYDQNPQHAQILAEHLTKTLKQPIVILSYPTLLNEKDIRIAFITNPSLHNTTLTEHLNTHQILSFSPFRRALEQGIDASIVVTHQVRPRLNLKQLNQKNIQLKPFFVQVAIQYEP
jgi:hypothetical protein